ncbi:Metallo-beta-lactamase superprotein [Pyrenophora tritici-repentis]|nr:Metallo-beta-lactamase superprotein [Pyrenophora tritici-repentis]
MDGFEGLHAPIYCFLVSNPCTGQHLLFDLGVRPDWRNYAPKTAALIGATTVVTPGSDVAGVLDADDSVGIRSTDINAVIWSHNHFDHIGDITRFPQLPILLSALVCVPQQGRVVREINFTDSGLKIGRFDAFDFFGDGSFYLLDAPGHAIGHICALARTDATCSPDGEIESCFVFMGADACHHMGVLRPSEYHPLPPSGSLQNLLSTNEQWSGFCPGLLEGWAKSHSTVPFFEVNAPGPIFPDGPRSFATVSKIQELDALDNIFVVMAHDLSLRSHIPLFPQRINGWKDTGIKANSQWLFCQDFVSNVVKRTVKGMQFQLK